MSFDLRAVCGSYVRPSFRALQSSPGSAQPASLYSHIRHLQSQKAQEAFFSSGSGSARRQYCSSPGTSTRNRQLNNVHTHALPATLLSIALTDESPVWTLDQIAGLVFGGIMLASVLLATKVDVYIARAQRRDLGLCEHCGGICEPEKCNAGDCPLKKKHS